MQSGVEMHKSFLVPTATQNEAGRTNTVTRMVCENRGCPRSIASARGPTQLPQKQSPGRPRRAVGAVPGCARPRMRETSRHRTPSRCVDYTEVPGEPLRRPLRSSAPSVADAAMYRGIRIKDLLLRAVRNMLDCCGKPTSERMGSRGCGCCRGKRRSTLSSKGRNHAFFPRCGGGAQQSGLSRVSSSGPYKQ